MKRFFSGVLVSVKIILGLFIVLQMAGLVFVVYKSRPVYLKLSTGHITFKREIRLDVNTKLPVTSSIHTTLQVPIKRRITLNLPIRGDLEVSIDEPFEIPVIAPVKVNLDHEFQIKKDITINSILPIDQTVETTLLGFDTTLPIKGEIPVTMTMDLDEMIPINDAFSMNITEPLTCRVTHDLTIPIDMMATTQFVIDQTIPVPVNADITTGIKLTGGLACFLYIDMFLDRDRGLVIDHWIEIE